VSATGRREAHLSASKTANRNNHGENGARNETKTKLTVLGFLVLLPARWNSTLNHKNSTHKTKQKKKKSLVTM
jgi:hypothetical protein